MPTALNTTLVIAGSYDDHTKPHSHVTHAQLTFFISCLIAAGLWLARLSKYLGDGKSLDGKAPDVESGTVQPKANGSLTGSKGSDVTQIDVKAVKPSPSAPPPPPTVDEALRGVVLFGLIMFYFFLCDYIKVRGV